MAKFSLPALFGLVLLAPSVSHSQAYPSRPVRMIVPYVAGGPVDSMARLLVPRLVDVWGQQVVIDNRGGANSIVGSEVAARAAPDGYTLALISASFTVNVSLYPKLPFDAVRDFTPITLVASGPGMLVTHPSLPVRNLKELIALAKAKPGALSYGSAGSDAPTSHLGMELLKISAGFRLGERNEFLQAAHRKRRMSYQHARPGCDQSNRREIAHRVERQLGVQTYVYRE